MLFTISAAILGATGPHVFHRKQSNVDELNDDPHVKYFEQIKDHYNVSDGTFLQRFYETNETDNNWKPGNPIFLYISGESDSFDHGYRGYVQQLANEWDAKVLALEHRYFGESYPEKYVSYTADLIKYLSVEQAMMDLAYFRVNYGTQIDPENKSKWIIVGGSYSGMVSALMRQNYSDLFVASWSSSGVVEALELFTECDTQGAIAMGPQCSQAARSTRIAIERIIEDDDAYEKLAELFLVPGMQKADFLAMLGDIFTVGLQYGNVRGLCDVLLDPIDRGTDPVYALSQYMRDYFSPKICGGNCTESYSTEFLKNPLIQNGGRIWTFLTCTQFGWWQVGTDRTSIRPPSVNKEYYQNQCHEIFDDPPIDDLNVSIFNERWGGLHQKTSHTYFVTSSQDPWTWACVTEDLLEANNSVAHTIVGPEMGHCSDLHQYSLSNAPDLIRTQENIKKTLAKWLNEDE